MNKIWVITISLFLVAGLSFSQLVYAKPDMNGKVVEIFFSAFGVPSITVIHTDKSFNIKKEYVSGTAPMNETGSLTQEEYDELLSYIRSTNIVNMSIKQKDDEMLLCEGISRITIAIDGKVNVIQAPCVGTQSPQTEKIMNITAKIEKKLLSLVDKNN